MPELKARLMGPPRFSIDGVPVEIKAAKSRALYCYLVATRQVHSRDRLAGLLWPEVPERNALASLRTALYDIRRGLGDHARDFLYVERTRVAFPEGASLDLDVAAIEGASHENDEVSADALQKAVDAYGGDFLEGIALPDAVDFDDWVFLERERLTHLYLSALCRLGTYHAARGDYPRAIEATRRVLAVDPLREDVHRAAMRYNALAGRREAALAQYRTCADLLQRELQIEPLAATTALYEQIVADEPLDDEEGGPAPISRAAVARSTHEALDPLAGLETRAAVVGRSVESEILAEAWRRAAQGMGGLVLVAGEPGIGKTRLIGELARAAADDATILFGRCYEGTSGEPYGPVVDALRSASPALEIEGLALPDVWLRELARLLPELEGALQRGQNEPLDGMRERDRLFEAARSLIAALSARQPVLFIVDDAQWADGTSLSLLEYIGRQCEVERLLLVVAFRSDYLDAERRQHLRLLGARGPTLELTRLSSSDTAELVKVLSGSEDAPARFGDRLYHATGGNPFFIVETLRALFDQGSLDLARGGWTTTSGLADDRYAALPVPETVGLIVDARLDRLIDDARALLDCAAVLRSDFEFEVVQQAAGIEPAAALDALDQLLGRGLLRERESDRPDLSCRYDFVHALVRDRVYGSLAGARRQYLHRQVAGRLEAATPPVPEQIAYHYTRGGVRDRACAWSLRAGSSALALYAGEDALVHFRAARELAVDDREEYAALSGMGDAFIVLGRPTEAIRCFEAALRPAPGGEERAELHRKMGRAHERQGTYDRALDCYGAAQEALGEVPMGATALRVADGLATVYVRLGRHAVAAGLCLDALAWLKANPEIEGARRLEAWIRNTLGMAHLHDGEHDAAVQNLELSLALKRELGDRLGEATLLNNLGVVFYRTGDDEAARRHYSESLEIKQEIGDGYGAAIAMTNLALIETHLGEYDSAAEHLIAATDSSGAVGARWLMPEIRRVAAQRALALGDIDEALAEAEGSLEAAEDLGVPAFIGVAHRVLGIVKGTGLGDDEAADLHFEASLAVFEMLDNEHELAKTHAAYGEALTHEGRAEDAQAHLEAALEVFTRTGAHGRLSRLEPLVGE